MLDERRGDLAWPSFISTTRPRGESISSTACRWGRWAGRSRNERSPRSARARGRGSSRSRSQQDACGVEALLDATHQGFGARVERPAGVQLIRGGRSSMTHGRGDRSRRSDSSASADGSGDAQPGEAERRASHDGAAHPVGRAQQAGEPRGRPARAPRHPHRRRAGRHAAPSTEARPRPRARPAGRHRA